MRDENAKRIAAELVALARRDEPPPGALERELALRLGPAAAGEAATRAAAPAKAMILGGLVLAVAGTFAVVGYRTDTRTPSTIPAVVSSVTTAVAAPTSEPPTSEPPTSEGEPAREGVSIDSLPTAAPAPRPTSSAPARPHADAPPPDKGAAPDPTLAEELARLRRARSLASTRPNEALATLDSHAADFPATTFREEAALIRVEALLAAGRRAEAERIAAPLLRDRSDAPVGRRLRDLLAPRDHDAP